MAGPVFAGPFENVPAGHWAYSALARLAGAGVIAGYPKETFMSDKPLTRFEVATILSRIITDISYTYSPGIGGKTAQMTQLEFKGSLASLVARLAREFAPELTPLGVRISDVSVQNSSYRPLVRAVVKIPELSKRAVAAVPFAEAHDLLREEPDSVGAPDKPPIPGSVVSDLEVIAEYGPGDGSGGGTSMAWGSKGRYLILGYGIQGAEPELKAIRDLVGSEGIPVRGSNMNGVNHDSQMKDKAGQEGVALGYALIDFGSSP